MKPFDTEKYLVIQRNFQVCKRTQDKTKLPENRKEDKEQSGAWICLGVKGNCENTSINFFDLEFY